MRTTALLLAPAFLLAALSPVNALAAEPYRAPAVSGDAYAYQRSGGGSGYGYRSETGERVGAPVQGQVNCQGYCLPPGYRIEDPYGPRYQPAPPQAAPPVHYEERGGGYVGEPVYHDDRGYVGEPAYHDGGARTGGPLIYEGEDRYGARRTFSEEREGYSWGYEAHRGWERHEEARDDWGRDDWGRDRCRQRFDDRGRMIESCGEIRLSDSFFWGGGGVGPEFIDGGGGGGGGGGGAYAEAGAGASAYASANASVGVSIRIGGKRGHGGKGGHKGGGCGKCGGH